MKKPIIGITLDNEESDTYSKFPWYAIRSNYLHSIEKFIVIQVIDSMSMMAGVYHPEWGLTLPSAIVEMETIRQNIPKTLNVFRGPNHRRQTYLKLQTLKFYFLSQLYLFC